MRKIGARAFVYLAAFSVGVSLTFFLNGYPDARFLHAADRSCQVKHVLADGRIFWTPCNGY